MKLQVNKLKIRICAITLFVMVFALQTEIIVAQIEYSETIQPIFTNHCTSCHGGTNGVTLSSYAEAMNSVGVQYGGNVIIPGNPAASPIVDKISNENPQHGVRMPEGGPYLSSAQINAIIQWIQEGASEEATSNENTDNVPVTFSLRGNYPNPFNPSTVIRFDLPAISEYRLDVFSIDGRKVMENAGVAQAGRAELSIDMQNDPSGIYIYRIAILKNGQTTEALIGRMTLIK
jgi:hypothetical protein